VTSEKILNPPTLGGSDILSRDHHDGYVVCCVLGCGMIEEAAAGKYFHKNLRPLFFIIY